MLSKFSKKFIVKRINCGKSTARTMAVAIQQPEAFPHEQYIRKDWSNEYSFASPESDFCRQGIIQTMETVHTNEEWSEQLSFASPESDFVATQQSNSNEKTNNPEWSHNLSFTSPESDFTGVMASESVLSKEDYHHVENFENNTWSGKLSFASPESDFTFNAENERKPDAPQPPYDDEMVLSLTLMSSPESAFGAFNFTEVLDESMKKDLIEYKARQSSLPRTLSEAMVDERPIVVTSASSPFSIVDVNQAWEGLCGYRREEAMGRNLGALLQGPDTNIAAAKDMVNQLKKEGYSEVILKNYTKGGRQFKNFLKAGPIYSDESNELFLVGILEELPQQDEPRKKYARQF